MKCIVELESGAWLLVVNTLQEASRPAPTGLTYEEAKAMIVEELEFCCRDLDERWVELLNTCYQALRELTEKHNA